MNVKIIIVAFFAVQVASGSFFDDVFKGVQNVANQAIQNVQDIGSSIVNTAGNAVNVVADATNQAIQTAEDTGASLVNGANNAINQVADVTNQVVQKAEDVGSSLTDGVTGAVNQITNVAGQAVQKAEDVGSSLTDGVSNTISQVTAGSPLDSLFQGVQDTVNQALQNAQSIGTALKDGVDNTVNQVVGNVNSAVEAAARNAISEVISHFQFPDSSDLGSAALSCLAAQWGTVSAIIEDAKSQVQTYILQETLEGIILFGKVDKTKAEVQTIFTSFTEDFSSCVSNGLLNVFSCATDLASNTISRITGTASELATEAQQTADFLYKLKLDAANTTNTIIQDTEALIQPSVQDGIVCIITSVLFP